MRLFFVSTQATYCKSFLSNHIKLSIQFTRNCCTQEKSKVKLSEVSKRPVRYFLNTEHTCIVTRIDNNPCLMQAAQLLKSIYTCTLKNPEQNVCGNCLCVCVGGPCVCSPSVRSASSPSLPLFLFPPPLPIRAAGVLAGFLAAVKTAPGEILSCKDQETLCVPACVFPCQDRTQT